jgi:hypothetical protein
MLTEVYVVETIDRVDSEVSTSINIFATEDKAKAFFAEKVKENIATWEAITCEGEALSYSGTNCFGLYIDGEACLNSFDILITKQSINY